MNRLTRWFKRIHITHGRPVKSSYKVIRAGNITIAEGLKCSFCGVIRHSDQISCICETVI